MQNKIVTEKIRIKFKREKPKYDEIQKKIEITPNKININ